MHSPVTSLRALLFGAVVVSTVSALGCSTGKEYEGKAFPVEGQLRYKDNTSATDLGGATLELESSSKEIIKIPITADGTFTRDTKLAAGKYRVRISAVPPPLPEAEYEMDAKFKSFDSGLTVTITDEATQRPNITLTRTQRANRS